MSSTGLTIAYSSLAERVGDISAPAERDDLEVLVLVQGELDPAVPLPPGRLIQVPGRGVARSRNAAIRHAGHRYLLFCDDDVEVRLEGVLAGVDHLRRTGAAIALGRASDGRGVVRKRYLRRRPGRLGLASAGKAATYEMLVDVEQVRAVGARFDERFGAGAEIYLGDEYLFIAEMLRAGLRGETVPYIFGIHPAKSSGSRWTGRDLHVRALVLNEVFGRGAPFVRAAFALRHARGMRDVRTGLAFLRDGARAEPAHDGAEPSPVVPPR